MQTAFTQEMFQMISTMYNKQINLEHQIDEMKNEINDLRNDVQGLLPEPVLIHETQKPVYKAGKWNDEETSSLTEIYNSRDHWTKSTITAAYNEKNSHQPRSNNQVQSKIYGLINKGIVPNKFGEMPEYLRKNKQ